MGTSAVMEQAPFWRTHWRLMLATSIVLGAYAFAAATLLPQWVVSLTAGEADPNTQLNAVTNTRGALLGILTPLVIVIGGLAALLNYQEVREQNRRTNEQARLEREETRRLRRASVYGELLTACHESRVAADTLYRADQDVVNALYHAGREEHPYLWYVSTNSEKLQAMLLSDDRVMLLGSDAVQAPARNLTRHCGAEIVMKASERPKVSDEEWHRISITEYAPLYQAFLNAARLDLAATR